MPETRIPLGHIRNFSIIAHVDHGKSTLADRLIQMCGGLDERDMEEQVLDSMDLERERGITIKAQCVALRYQAKDNTQYLLNLIDTPGHVDFSYEVSRSLASCDGALLVVDASQGVEAQSVANCWTAIDLGLEVIPVINKIDLPQADAEKTRIEIEEFTGLDTDNALEISAKSGQSVDDLLEQIVHEIPPPKSADTDELRALIIDSWFDNYLGIVSLVRIFSGTLAKGDRIVAHSVGKTHVVDEVGIFTPTRVSRNSLSEGEVGYVIAGIKNLQGSPVGDTIRYADSEIDALPGFAKSKPLVFAGLFPTQTDDYQSLRNALEKLCLNDTSLHFYPENSQALGFGFRCGFLGLLHMEIVQERLEREYDLDLITTAPSVVYEVVFKDGQIQQISNPNEVEDLSSVKEIREPIAEANILVPSQHVGRVMELCVSRRGTQKDLQYVGNQMSLTYEIPLVELVMDFHDRVKSVSRGFASLDYNFVRFQAAPLVRLDILINGEQVDSLASIVHESEARTRGHQLAVKMKELIPRQMYEVAIQAAIGRHILVRTTVKAFRKNVTAKCYGGDVTRKKKLLQKQREGKKRMKRVGKVEIPQQAFLAALKIDR